MTPGTAKLAALTIAASLLASGVASAGPPASSAGGGLQELVDQIVARGAPGATLLVRDGESTETFTSGVADRKTERPLGDKDLYRVGSVTKTLISTLALQLVEQGKLDLDATVADYLAQLLPTGDEITIRQLLNHTSGLFSFNYDRKFVRQLLQGDSFRPRELIAYSTRHDVLFPPGTDWSYSNTNYIVVGLLVRTVGGEKVKSQLADRILRPLGLTATTLPMRDTGFDARHAHGYVGRRGGGLWDVTLEFSPTWIWAAGAVISNTSDLATFYRGLLAGDLLEPESLDEMKTTVSAGPGVGYGLGILSLNLPCGTAWGHDGIFIGYYTVALSTEDGARQAAVMMNVDPVNGFPPPGAQAAAFNALTAGFCGEDATSILTSLGPTPDLAHATLTPRPSQVPSAE